MKKAAKSVVDVKKAAAGDKESNENGATKAKPAKSESEFQYSWLARRE